jgi:ADP-heptose:LPS heptosyltransferase
MQRRRIVGVLRAAGPVLVRRRQGDPRRILVQSTGGFGNTLMATPLLRAVREAFPEAHIALFTSGGAAELLRHNPHLNAVIADAGGGSAYLRQVRALRRERFDLCFMALNAVVFRHGLRPLLAGVPDRVIHRYPFQRDDDFTPLYTRIVEKHEGRHDCEGNVDLLRAYTGANDIATGPMELPLPETVFAAARTRLTEQGWREDVQTLAVCPGCRAWARDKRWPLPHYAALLHETLQAHANLHIFGFCGPEEQEEADYLTQHVQHPRFRLVRGLKLPEFAAALKLCGRVLSNDSLPVHICSALQIPVAALYGPTDPRLIGPWQTPSLIVQSPCEYAPYFRIPYPPDMAKDDPCMGMISVEMAQAAVDQLLTM